jgi:hypothetical protein
MFNHEYDENGHHRITYYAPSSDQRTHTVSGVWVPYHVPSIVNVGDDMYVAYTTYNYPAKNGPHDSNHYPGPYGDVIYKLTEVN